MPNSGQELSARFVLVRELGAGGGGEVWLAQDRERGCNVALKRLSDALANDAEAIAAIEHVVAQLTALDDPNILRMDGVIETPPDAWLAMEYAAGGDLTSLRGRPIVEWVRATLPIAQALARVHRAGLVHRDVKPSNVLLMANGTSRLADFGAVLARGERPQRYTAQGSLYNMSPQQLAGEPATIADDVYGFGAMLYELSSGYPPFYPDISPARIGNEAPAPPQSRSALPEVLQNLIARCLQKAPTDRPASMDIVAAELQRALEHVPAPSVISGGLEQSMSNETATGTVQRPDAPLVRPPAAPAEPLRGEWQRTTQRAPDPAEFRREGFRRGMTVSVIALGIIGLFVVFFLLPKWVGGDQSAQARPTPTKPVEAPKVEQPKADIDFAALARAKQQAEEVREPLAERLEKLRERAVEQWGADDHKLATEELAAGDTQFAAREYLVAVAHFEKVEPLVVSLEARAGLVLKEQLAAGSKAIVEGRSADAKSAYELALKLEPKNALAKRGLQRASTLDQVLALMTTAGRAEQDGNLNAAITDYRKALDLDKDTQAASDGLNRVSSRVAGDSFASAMARGFAELGGANYAGARSAFESAGKIRPNSPEVAAALKQIDQEQRTRIIAAKLDEARAFEAREQWADALKLYREVVGLDSTVAFANDGVTRVQPRAALNEQLEMYLTQPERLFSAPVRTSARDTLQRAGAVAAPGPVLTQQIAKLRDWLARADVPVTIALQSDNLTQVTIYRVGALGAFEQRSLELEPGEYTVLGTRPGYRDVRRQLMIVPGMPSSPIVIRCEDRI